MTSRVNKIQCPAALCSPTAKWPVSIDVSSDEARFKRRRRDNCPRVRTEFLINAPRFVSAPLGWNKVFQRGSVSYDGRRIGGGVIRRLLLRAALLARQRSKGGIPRRQESTEELLPVAARWQAECDDSARKLAGTMRRRRRRYISRRWYIRGRVTREECRASPITPAQRGSRDDEGTNGGRVYRFKLFFFFYFLFREFFDKYESIGISF